IPLEAAECRNLRGSRPFWSILGERRIWSTILRVPITFPPDTFYGAELSAMSAPDLLGTQGTFFLFTTRPSGARFKEGGTRVEVVLRDGRIETAIVGPDNPFVVGHAPMRLPMTIVLDRARETARITLRDTTVELRQGVLSDWIRLTFRAAPG